MMAQYAFGGCYCDELKYNTVLHVLRLLVYAPNVNVPYDLSCCHANEQTVSEARKRKLVTFSMHC